MTATPDAHSAEAAAPTTDEYASLCDQARDLARNGHLKRAARLYQQVLDDGPERHRARAALGLAVVRHDIGDVAAAREADRVAIATGDTEFGARAAYHLAVSYEREGAVAEARHGWQQVVEFGNDRYLPAAHLGLARGFEEEGAAEAAREHWNHALDSEDPDIVVAAARDYAQRLLMRGDAAAAMPVLDRARERGEENPGLRVLAAAAHVERAIEELSGAVAASEGEPESGHVPEPGDAAAAVELLARLLAVRGDPDASADTWGHGLRHTDPEVAADVQRRLRRGLPAPDPEAESGPDPEQEAADPAADGPGTPWWDDYLVAAVASDTAPHLAGELFAALTRAYLPAAMAHANDETDVHELRDAIATAVRMPGEYVWGQALHDDFRERLRQALGATDDVLPAGWPEH